MRLLSDFFNFLDELWAVLQSYRAWLRIQHDMDQAWIVFRRGLANVATLA